MEKDVSNRLATLFTYHADLYIERANGNMAEALEAAKRDFEALKSELEYAPQIYHAIVTAIKIKCEQGKNT